MVCRKASQPHQSDRVKVQLARWENGEQRACYEREHGDIVGYLGIFLDFGR
jgi:hypothetical protein